MPPTIRQSNSWRCAEFANILAAIFLSAGCAASSVTPGTAGDQSVPVAASSFPKPVSVVRYGRYTLVELAPDTAQQELLNQVVDISIPSTMSTTLGDALGYLLLRSGYQLCETRDEVGRLYALPLPAAHMHMGPMFLRDALQTLAGPAWQLQVDDVTRQVCFTLSAKAANIALPTTARSTAEVAAKLGGSAKVFALPKSQP